MTIPIRSEIAGSIWKIEATDGASVSAGDVLIIMESMKMEIPVEAPAAGVCRLTVAEGDVVQEGDLLAEIT